MEIFLRTAIIRQSVKRGRTKEKGFAVTTENGSNDIALLRKEFIEPDLTGITSRFNKQLGESICLQIREGFTLKQIVDRLPIRSVTTIYAWRATNQAFREAYELAKKDAADTYADKILEIAEEKDIPKEEVPGRRLSVESYKWLAEKANPQKYSPKSVIAADEDNPLQILIDTGIGRDDPDPIKAEYTNLDDKIDTDEKRQSDLEDGDNGDGA